MAGIAGRSDPKPGNKNALKNCSKIDRRGLTVGELPTAMISVKREGRKYRRYVEQAVLDCKGVIDDLDNHLIDAAVGCTMSAGIARWLFRNRYKEMTITDIRATSKEIRDAKSERARLVRQLELRIQPEPVDLKTYLIDGTVKQ
jgi:hypothetical protein